MCDAKPGPRCAGDTRAGAATAMSAYETAYPEGPQVGPLVSARMAPQAKASDRLVRRLGPVPEQAPRTIPPHLIARLGPVPAQRLDSAALRDDVPLRTRLAGHL